MDLAKRHPSTTHLLDQFDDPYLPTLLKKPSAAVQALAMQMVEEYPDSPELTHGLRQLLNAKEAFVRCASAKVKSRVPKI